MKKKDPWRNVSADMFTLKKQLKEVTVQRDLLLAAGQAWVHGYLKCDDVWAGFKMMQAAIAAVTERS